MNSQTFRPIHTTLEYNADNQEPIKTDIHWSGRQVCTAIQTEPQIFAGPLPKESPKIMSDQQPRNVKPAPGIDKTIDDSEWIKTVDQIMIKINTKMKYATTYWKYIHSKKFSSAWSPDQLINSKQQKSAINLQNKCRDPNNQKGIYSRSLVGGKSSNFPVTCVSKLQLAIDNNFGNCGERTRYFARLYRDKYPNHTIEILALNNPGDHSFVRITAKDMPPMIVDPWAFRYFRESEQKTFLCNPKNADYDVLFDDDQLDMVYQSHSDRLPEELKEVHSKLTDIEPFEAKITCFESEFKKRFSDGSFTTGYTIKPDEDNVIEGNYKLYQLSYSEKSAMYVLTDSGLSKWV